MTPFANKGGFGILAVVLLIGTVIAAVDGTPVTWLFAAGCAYCAYTYATWDRRDQP